MAKKGDFWVGMLVGAAAGAVTALLYAPKKGDDLRHDISERAHDVGRKAGEAWGDVKMKTGEMAEKAQAGVQSAVGRGREMMASGQQRVREAISVGRHAAEEKREELESELARKQAEAREKIGMDS